MEKINLPPIKDSDIELAEKEALESLKNDQEVYSCIKSLGLSGGEVKANIAVLLDFKRDKEICRNCPGLKDCPKARRHLIVRPIRSEDGLDLVVDVCPKKSQESEANSRFIEADMPFEWKQNDLKQIDKTANKNTVTAEFAKIIRSDSNSWPYLFGIRNQGRTFMLSCFASTYCQKRNAQCCFVDATSCIKKLSDLYYASHDKSLFEKKLSLYQNVPLLVLDDIGNEFISEFNYSTILYPILNERAKKGLITAFSSDFSLDELCEMYSQKLGKIRGRQLSSLLNGQCKIFEISGVKIH